MKAIYAPIYLYCTVKSQPIASSYQLFYLRSGQDLNSDHRCGRRVLALPYHGPHVLTRRQIFYPLSKCVWLAWDKYGTVLLNPVILVGRERTLNNSHNFYS